MQRVAPSMALRQQLQWQSPQTVETLDSGILLVGERRALLAAGIWPARAVACPGVAEVSGVKGRAVGPSREARCAAPLRPEGRPRSLRGAAGRISGGEAVSAVVCAAVWIRRSCRHLVLRLKVGLGAGALVVDRAEHAVGGVAPHSVVLIDPVRHCAAGLLAGGEVSVAE